MGKPTHYDIQGTGARLEVDSWLDDYKTNNSEYFQSDDAKIALIHADEIHRIVGFDSEEIEDISFDLEQSGLLTDILLEYLAWYEKEHNERCPFDLVYRVNVA